MDDALALVIAAPDYRSEHVLFEDRNSRVHIPRTRINDPVVIKGPRAFRSPHRVHSVSARRGPQNKKESGNPLLLDYRFRNTSMVF